jgi:hypothetical protein
MAEEQSEGVVARRGKGHAAAHQPPVAPELQFERELEVFRTEAQTATQFFYAHLAIHATAGAEKAVFRLLNTAPLFWNTVLGGLQTASFVALGRVFDQNSAHNVDRLLKIAQDHPQIFSMAALAARKQGTGASPPPWLNDYMNNVYVPKPADFRRLRGYVSKQRKIYVDKYRPLRHQVFAHKGLSDPADVSALFARTNIREVQRILVFLMSLNNALWGLFMNGHRPVLRPHRYSVNRMLARAAKNPRGGVVHERLVYEAAHFLTAAGAAKPAGR